MSERRKHGNVTSLPALPSTQRVSRTLAEEVTVQLPPVAWTPDLVDRVASVLADALVRDLQQRPPGNPGRFPLLTICSIEHTSVYGGSAQHATEATSSQEEAHPAEAGKADGSHAGVYRAPRNRILRSEIIFAQTIK